MYINCSIFMYWILGNSMSTLKLYRKLKFFCTCIHNHENISGSCVGATHSLRSTSNKSLGQHTHCFWKRACSNSILCSSRPTELSRSIDPKDDLFQFSNAWTDERGVPQLRLACLVKYWLGLKLRGPKLIFH